MPGVTVFTYGSLMFAEVWQGVVAGHYASTSAVVEGHARFAVRHATYPGMVAQAESRVSGIVYFDVSESDVAALDAFEGDAYRRVKVPARLPNGEIVTVDAYLFLNPEALLNQGWEPATFQLQRFLDTYCGKNA